MKGRVLGIDDIPNDVQQFIFDFIDSVEQLEVLIFLRTHPQASWTAQQISDEFRSNPASIERRLALLHAACLIEQEKGMLDRFRYHPSPRGTDVTVEKLTSEYKTRRQSLLQLIFSPLKKGRTFANAFVVRKPPPDGDDNG